jgi:hypothetical protein
MRSTTSRPLPLARSTRRAVAASVGSMLFVALVSATPNSPFYPVLPLNYEPSGPLRWVSDLIGLTHLTPMELVVVGLLATTSAALGFLLMLREAWNGRMSMRTVLLLALAFHVAVLTLPLLFSRDVYSYAYYGKTVSTYNANPYVMTPDDMSQINAMYGLVWPGWRGTPSVYGPLFTWVSAFLTRLVRSPSSVITGFQALAAAASLATAAIIARTVQRVRPERAVFAAAIIGLNPIVVFHVVGGGHNDMLVAFFIAAAVALLFARRDLLSAVCLGLGMSVKATALVPLVLLLVAVAATSSPARRRRVILRYGAVVGGVWLVMAIPFLQASNPTLGLIEVAGHDSWMAPGQLVVHLFGGTGRLLGGETAGTVGEVLARVGLFGLSAAGVVLIARHLWLRPEARTPERLAAAWGWALLVVILPSPVLFTWYLVWILPLAWVLPRVPRRGLVLLSAFFIVTQLVTESSRLPEQLKELKFPFGHPIAIAVLFWVGRDFVRRIRTGRLLDEDEPGEVFGDRFERGGGDEGPSERLRRLASTSPSSGGAARVPSADRVAAVGQIALMHHRV